MVYGLTTPGSFGRYFLDGAFVDWRETLEQLLSKVSEEDERSAYRNDPGFYKLVVTQKFVHETGRVLGDQPPLPPLRDEECPRIYKTFEKVGDLGSLVKVENRLLLIDEGLKQVIETIEPDVHRIWPVRIVQPDGTDHSACYYGLQINSFMDSFSPGESDPTAFQGKPGRYRVFQPYKQHYARLALSAAGHAGKHLWRERSLRDPEICFSDEFLEVALKARLDLPKSYYALKEV